MVFTIRIPSGILSLRPSYGLREFAKHTMRFTTLIGLEVARIGDSEPRPSWTFAGSTEAYPRDDL